MGEQDWGDPFWRSIAEPDEPVVVLRGLRATLPSAYDRYYARHPRPTRADRWLGGLQRFASLAFSAVMHVLVVVLLAEVLYISVPVIEDIIVTAQLHRPGSKADVPSPEPAAKKEEESREERPAEAPLTAEQPAPLEKITSFVAGAGGADASARPVPQGVIENVQEIREAELAHFTGAGMFEARGEGARKAAVGRYGGNDASEAAVELGLRWLAAHQLGDGSWSASLAEKCPPGQPCGRGGRTEFSHGVTGLALLAFLAGGYTHKAGPYEDVVAGGLRWLVNRQDPNGFFFDSAKGMYGHGVATFALGEAAAMTRDESLRRPLERAVAAIEASQQPNGGWYYSADPSQRASEFTLSVWQMMGLKAAEKAGVPVPAGVIDRAKAYVRASTDPGGGVYYSHRSNVTLGSTGAGVFARCMFGMTEGSWIEKGLAYLEANEEGGPGWGGRGHNFQYLYAWYYRTLASFQVQGRAWREWNRKLRPHLVSTQRTQGHAAGSWPIIDYSQAGTSYATAMCVLMLETYYRYLPMANDRTALLDAVTAGEGAGNDITPEEVRRIEQIRPPSPEEAQVRRAAERDEALQRLKSEKPEDRYLAARKLAELGEKAALKEMIAAADREFRLKPVHVTFIGRLKTEEALPYLMKQLDDPDENVRGSAMNALMSTTGVYIAEPHRWREWYADYLRRKGGGK